MQRFDNTYTNEMNSMGRPPMAQDMGDWGAEINGGGMNHMAEEDQMQSPMWQGRNMDRPMSDSMMNRNPMMNGGQMMNGSQMMNNGSMDRGDDLADSMQNNLSEDVIGSPTTVQEAYYGSLRAFLSQNKGNYVVATFLIGTQGTAEFEGVLYEVGNDYMVIYQEGRDRYIVVDIYSLKYIEFYDTERRRLCNQLLRQQGMWPMGGQMGSMQNGSMQWSPVNPMQQR